VFVHVLDWSQPLPALPPLRTDDRRPATGDRRPTTDDRRLLTARTSPEAGF